MRLNPFYILILALFSFFNFMGCQSKPKISSCETSDWFEMGRQAGTAGRVTGAPEERGRCPLQFNKVSEALYQNGYNYGLTDYCTPENGYQVARLGLPLLRICPRPTNTAFEASYKKGAKVREIEQANVALDRKISSINVKIKKTRLSASQKQELSGELTGLNEARTANQRRIQKLDQD